MTKLTKTKFLEHVEEAMSPPDMTGVKEKLLQAAQQMPIKKPKNGPIDEA